MSIKIRLVFSLFWCVVINQLTGVTYVGASAGAAVASDKRIIISTRRGKIVVMARSLYGFLNVFWGLRSLNQCWFCEIIRFVRITGTWCVQKITLDTNFDQCQALFRNFWDLNSYLKPWLWSLAMGWVGQPNDKNPTSGFSLKFINLTGVKRWPYMSLTILWSQTHDGASHMSHGYQIVQCPCVPWQAQMLLSLLIHLSSSLEPHQDIC